MSWRMCCPSLVGRSIGSDCTCVIHGTRQAAPCPTVLSAPDQRLKTTPTLPGWMMVNEDQTAAIKKTIRPSTTPLASMAGAFARTSSVMAIPPPELPVAAPLEDDDAPRAARGAAAQETGDAGFEPAAQRAERPVEREHHPHQDEQLAGAEHRRGL